MKLEELVGQRLVIGIFGTRITPEIVRHFQELHAGGLILYRRNFDSPVQIKKLIADLEEGLGRKLLVTTDQNLRHQQNLANRRIAILVLKTASWPKDSKAHGHGCHGCRWLGSGGVPGAVVPRVTAGPASRLPVSSFRSRSGEKPTAQTTCSGYHWQSLA